MTQPIPVFANDDALMGHTRDLRLKMVSALMPNGDIPANDDDRKLILATLDSIDRVAIAKKRIKQEDKQLDIMSRGAAIVDAVLGRLAGQPAPIPINDNAPIPVPRGKLVEQVLIAPGELELGSENIDYNTFIVPYLANRT